MQSTTQSSAVLGLPPERQLDAAISCGYCTTCGDHYQNKRGAGGCRRETGRIAAMSTYFEAAEEEWQGEQKEE
jgi:hypothetical protein